MNDEHPQNMDDARNENEDAFGADASDWYDEGDYDHDPLGALEEARANGVYEETARIIADEHVELRRIIQLLVVGGFVTPEKVREARKLARMLD